ncbi:Hypothetical_protein [Hexamita inflata]|uniref:Hypothetical_protein n=1 Tax=Hexamita inflata TaxID=28002 RepID=A0AA86PL19_9EUKA|nr:Hypothetical protein HINF_LOCUS24774 [Hexamita inflata]
MYLYTHYYLRQYNKLPSSSYDFLVEVSIVALTQVVIQTIFLNQFLKLRKHNRELQQNGIEVMFVINYQLFSIEVWSKIESVVRLLQFLQFMLVQDTQDSRQNGFHIPHVVLKCEVVNFQF